MKKNLLVFLVLSTHLLGICQEDSKISSVDYVAVLNSNHAETLFYYQNNWKALREAFLKKDYIASYNFLEIEPSEATPYNFILITTYANKEQYENREIHFEELTEASGVLKLLNEKVPADFRKVIHGQDLVKNW